MRRIPEIFRSIVMLEQVFLLSFSKGKLWVYWVKWMEWTSHPSHIYVVLTTNVCLCKVFLSAFGGWNTERRVLHPQLLNQTLNQTLALCVGGAKATMSSLPRLNLNIYNQPSDSLHKQSYSQFCKPSFHSYSKKRGGSQECVWCPVNLILTSAWLVTNRQSCFWTILFIRSKNSPFPLATLQHLNGSVQLKSISHSQKVLPFRIQAGRRFEVPLGTC